MNYAKPFGFSNIMASGFLSFINLFIFIDLVGSSLIFDSVFFEANSSSISMTFWRCDPPDGSVALPLHFTPLAFRLVSLTIPILTSVPIAVSLRC